MKKVMTSFVTVLAFLCLSASAYATTTKGLLVLLAKQASLQAVKDHPGFYQLTLKGVNPKVIYFSDRPARTTGQIDMAKFVNEWTNGGFKKLPPNAMMEAVTLNAATKQLQANMTSYPMVLNNPVYMQKNDELSFEVKGLANSSMTLATVQQSDYVAVFIDSVCISCIHG